MKFIKIGLIFLGIIFLIILILATYVYIANPVDSTITEKYNHPLLSETQEKALKSIGIDPVDIPTEITPEMEECFIEKIGKERVEEIKGGSSPSGVELFKAKSCI